MADWANLPVDLVITVAKLMVLIEDFIVFGAVCKTWRSAATKENFNSGFGVPFLVFPMKEGDAIREFYSLAKRKIHKLNLPKALSTKAHCYSSLGWLLIIPFRDFKPTLLNPITLAQIALPDFEEFQYPVGLRNVGSIIHKFVLSSSPSCSTSDCIVMVFYAHDSVAFCKLGEAPYWTYITSVFSNKQSIYDIAYYKGQFYAVTFYGIVLVFDIENPKKVGRFAAPWMPSQLIMTGEPVSPINSTPYIVESGGSLLVVLCYEQRNHSITDFRVFKVPCRCNFNTNRWWDSEVKNLGNRTLFLGDNNSSFSIEASDYYGCKANCIYFIDNSCLLNKLDIGCFNMEDGKIERHFDKLPSFLSGGRQNRTCLNMYSWIQPSF